MSVRNPNYQQVHDLYELCSDGRSLQEFCRMSGVSYQKYLEWELNTGTAVPRLSDIHQTSGNPGLSGHFQYKGTHFLPNGQQL